MSFYDFYVVTDLYLLNYDHVFHGHLNLLPRLLA